jgi:hypothetical protein
MQHARDLAGKSGLDVLVVAPPPEVFALGDAPQASVSDPPIDELQEPAPEQHTPAPSTLNFHDLFKARAIDLQLPGQRAVSHRRATFLNSFEQQVQPAFKPALTVAQGPSRASNRR